jgi:hypothetical protein
MLGKVEDAQACLDLGSRLDAEAMKPLFDLMVSVKAELAKKEMEQQKRDKIRQQSDEAMAQALSVRGIQFDKLTLSERLFARSEFLDSKVKRYDDDNSLSWPVLVVYPEVDMFDFGDGWHETSRFKDELTPMLSDRSDLPYQLNQIAIHVPLNTGKWHRLPLMGTLSDLYRLTDYSLPRDQFIRLWILPLTGSFARQFLKQQR